MRDVNEPESVNAEGRHPICQMLRKMLNFEILASPTFFLVNLTGMVAMIGYLTPYQFLADNAKTIGFSDDEAGKLMSYLGLSNTIGRVVSGVITDLPCMDPVWMNNFSLMLAGTMVSLIPLFRTYAFLITGAVFFGLFIGTSW